MLQLQLSLDFDCYHCERSISITVECRGGGLAAGPATVAAVRVPCPRCRGSNRVCFHPNGNVVDVLPGGGRSFYLPSLN